MLRAHLSCCQDVIAIAPGSKTREARHFDKCCGLWYRAPQTSDQTVGNSTLAYHYYFN